MANPINITIATAQRNAGAASSATHIYPGGYSSITVTLSIPTTSDYENTANQFTLTMDYDKTGGTNFAPYVTETWTGGHALGRPQYDANGDMIPGSQAVDPPPTLFADITQLPVGSNVRVTVSINNSMNIGLTAVIAP